MSRWALLLVVLALPLVSLGTSCTPGPMPGDDTNDNTDNTNGDTNDNTSGGDAILNIQFDAPGTAYVRVVGFVNKGNLDRSESESTTTPWAFNDSYDPGGSNGASHVYPKGTQICLICSESEGISSPANTGVPPQQTTAGQFVDWQGDTQGASIGNDAGILFFTLNEDRTITARFKVMQGVVIRSQGGANGTGTQLDIDFLAQAPLTIPPRFTGNSRGVGMVGTGLTGQQGQIGKWYFFRDDTVLKFTVPPTAPFTSWSGDGSIGGREVTFTFGQRMQTVDLNWP